MTGTVPSMLVVYTHHRDTRTNKNPSKTERQPLAVSEDVALFFGFPVVLLVFFFKAPTSSGSVG